MQFTVLDNGYSSTVHIPYKLEPRYGLQVHVPMTFFMKRGLAGDCGCHAVRSYLEHCVNECCATPASWCCGGVLHNIAALADQKVNQSLAPDEIHLPHHNIERLKLQPPIKVGIYGFVLLTLRA